MKKILVSGSIAFDHVKKFNGRFADVFKHDLANLSVSLVVDSLTEHDGGVAANIAFTLSCFGERATILSAAGSDFGPYRKRLDVFADTSHVTEVVDLKTARADIVTDVDQNQITTFYPGALVKPCDAAIQHADVALVSAGNSDDMERLPWTHMQQGTPFFFDPGQMTAALSEDVLRVGIEGANGLLLNTYEWEMYKDKTGYSESDVLVRTPTVIVTRGKEGSDIITRDGRFFVHAVAADAIDPSGAGDAYRAGFVYGFLKKLPLVDCVRMGSTAAAFAVESEGMQNHGFTLPQFFERYERAYGQIPVV